MNAPYVLGGLLVAAGTFYVTTRILLRRRLAAEAYRAQTSTRIKHAGWRTHGNVTYLGGGYVYAPTKTTEQQEGGGSDGQRLEAPVGVVAPPIPWLGAKGVPSDPPRNPTSEGGTPA